GSDVCAATASSLSLVMRSSTAEKLERSSMIGVGGGATSANSISASLTDSASSSNDTGAATADGSSSSGISTVTSNRSLLKKPPLPRRRTLSAARSLASAPSSARTAARAASRVGPSNCRVGKVHHSDRFEEELLAELGVGEHRQTGSHCPHQAAHGGTKLGGA